MSDPRYEPLDQSHQQIAEEERSREIALARQQKLAEEERDKEIDDRGNNPYQPLNDHHARIAAQELQAKGLEQEGTQEPEIDLDTKRRDAELEKTQEQAKQDVELEKYKRFEWQKTEFERREREEQAREERSEERAGIMQVLDPKEFAREEQRKQVAAERNELEQQVRDDWIERAKEQQQAGRGETSDRASQRQEREEGREQTEAQQDKEASRWQKEMTDEARALRADMGRSEDRDHDRGR